MSVVINVSKCSWGKCNFCAYNSKKLDPIDIKTIDKDLIKEIEKVKSGKQEYVKIFNGGSWFNNETPIYIKEHIYKTMEDNNIKSLRVENRVDEVNWNEVKKLVDNGYNLTISWGIETISDLALNFINKGVTSNQIINCIIKSHNMGCKNSIYLLMGMPTDMGYIADTFYFKKSIDWVKKNHHMINELIIGYYAPMKGSYWYDEIWITNKFRVLSKNEADKCRDYVSEQLEDTNIKCSYFIYTWRYYHGCNYEEYRRKLKGENKSKN